MRILLKQFYRGRLTNEQLIPPGEYTDGEESLRGVPAVYLVEKGFAEVLSGGKPAPAPVPVENADELDDLTVAELKDIAEEKGIDISGLRLKSEIVSAIRESE